MSFENILYEIEDGILTITLNRPEILNAFSGGMLRDIIEAFDNEGFKAMQFSVKNSD